MAVREIIRCDSWTSGKKLVSGDAILYLIRLIDNNELGEREFVASLNVGDGILPHQVIFSGEKNYVLCLSISKDTVLKDENVEESFEQNLIFTSIQKIFSKNIVKKSSEEMLKLFALFAESRRIVDASYKQDNNEELQQKLKDNFEELSNWAGISNNNNKDTNKINYEDSVIVEPFEQEITPKYLIKYLLKGTKKGLFMILFTGLIVSAFGTIFPIATKHITSTLIPRSDVSGLKQLAILLIFLALSETLISVVPSLISLIMSFHVLERLQTALFDHILKVPVNMFRQFSAGDLTSRVMSIGEIQNVIFGVISRQIVASLFSLSALIMMFYYQKTLAFAGLLMLVVYFIVVCLLMIKNREPLSNRAKLQGSIDGILKEFVSGISKIRLAGAEKGVLNRFFKDFNEMVKQNFIVSKNTSIQHISSMEFSIIIVMIFYSMIGFNSNINMDFSVFLAFMAAFEMLKAGFISLIGNVWSLMEIKPLIERLKPILTTNKEDNGHRVSPGKLDGSIEISHASFSYLEDSPEVLHDVSIHVNPGEFVAIVGTSGAGKSTLVRLLLGFENPKKGAVYYSGKNLANLNLSEVRSQLGVILQSCKIFNGSILDNIIIGANCTLEKAEEALKKASLYDEVMEMPMGIQTMVADDTLSGGQQQRLLIARALLNNPKIIIMDESTSALDNISQKNISDNLEKMNATRIVIAHRLSTIANADRIYVLDKGRIVEHGTYKELIDKDGFFKKLALRQLTKDEG